MLEVPFTATHDQVIGRARGRWVFVDPGAQPGTAAAAPRQRARRTLAGSAAALPGSAAALPGWDPTFDVPKELQHNKNNKSQILGLANGPHLEEWKIMALRTTNQARAAYGRRHILRPEHYTHLHPLLPPFTTRAVSLPSLKAGLHAMHARDAHCRC